MTTRGPDQRASGHRPPSRVPRWGFNTTLRNQHGFVGAVCSIYADYYAARDCGAICAMWFESQDVPPSTKDQVFYGLVSLDAKGAVLIGELDAKEA